MHYLISIVGLLLVLFLAWVASNNKKKIKYRPIIVMIVIQLILGFLLLKTSIGELLIKGFADNYSYMQTKEPILYSVGLPMKERILFSCMC